MTDKKKSNANNETQKAQEQEYPIKAVDTAFIVFGVAAILLTIVVFLLRI